MLVLLLTEGLYIIIATIDAEHDGLDGVHSHHLDVLPDDGQWVG